MKISRIIGQFHGSNVVKILEKSTENYFIEFIDKFKILSDNQFGFRDKSSTQDVIDELTSKIYNFLDKSKSP